MGRSLAELRQSIRIWRTKPDLQGNMAEIGRTVYDRDAQDYVGRELHPVEQRMLVDIGQRWGSTRMLDIGIGSGRTTYTFGPICSEYIGIDYSAGMVERARKRIGTLPRVKLRQGNALSMPEYADGSFDVVLFSFNGIDSLDHTARRAAMSEIRRVLRPGGLFVFSSHSLIARHLDLPRISVRHPLRGLRHMVRVLRDHVLFRIANASVDFPTVLARGHAVLIEAHGFTLPLYYATGAENARQISEAGLTLDAVYNYIGDPLPPPYETTEPWLYYWCHRLS